MGRNKVIHKSMNRYEVIEQRVSKLPQTNDCFSSSSSSDMTTEYHPHAQDQSMTKFSCDFYPLAIKNRIRRCEHSKYMFMFLLGMLVKICTVSPIAHVEESHTIACLTKAE